LTILKLGKINIQLTLAILISLAITCFLESSVFTDRDAINDDVRNQIYWMAQQNDPELFQNDLIASYFSQSSTVSPILKAIYGLFPDSVDPKILSQFLPFVLVVIATFLLFKFAESIASARYAFWLCFIFNIYIWMVSNIPGGLPRAFFYPLLFSFFYFYARKHWLQLAIVFLLQTQIYPVVFFICASTLIIELLFDYKCKNIKNTQIYGSIAAIASGLAGLFYRFVLKHSASFGPLTTVQEALTMPEFFIKGRIKAFLIPYEFVNGKGSINELLSENHNFFVSVLIKSIVVIPIGFLCIMIYKKIIKPKVGKLIIPRIFYSCIISALILFAISSCVLFYLYLPSRYLEYCLPLVSIFVIGSFIYQLENIIPRFKPLFSVAIICISIWIISPSWRNGLKSLDKNQKEIYTYLLTKPKNIMIAAPYSISSNVPAYAYRSVIVSHEAFIPFHKNYYSEMQTRREDLQNVYKTNDIAIVKAYIKKYNIDYFIVKKSSKDKATFLSSVPQNCIDFQNEEYLLVSSLKVLRMS